MKGSSSRGALKSATFTKMMTVTIYNQHNSTSDNFFLLSCANQKIKRAEGSLIPIIQFKQQEQIQHHEQITHTKF